MKLKPIAPPALRAPQPAVTERAARPFGAHELSLEVGGVAGQATQAVWLRHGQTALLATLTDAPPPAVADFRPLTVDYYERPGAVGQLPGGHQRREGRATDHEVRVSRLIDRALRPLFDEEERRELHVVVQLLSFDPHSDLLGLAITAAGAVAQLSPIPFRGPVAGASEQGEGAHADWVVAASPEGVVMLEGGDAPAAPAAVLARLQALAGGLAPAWECAQELAARAGAVKAPYVSDHQVMEHPAFDDCLDELGAALTRRDKRARDAAYQALLARLQAEVAAPRETVALTLWSLTRAWLRAEALDGRRQDGRAPHELRAMRVELGALPRAAGSALLSRGDTQALVSVTGGAAEAPSLGQVALPRGRSPLLCHYNFHGFATHQTRAHRGPNRREVGHGLLLQRALEPLFEAPRGQTLTRVLADVLSSDGSSSMLSACAATLALAQAGAPLRSPVVGVSLGLVSEGGEAALLLDISGDEDFYGDMDLKVAGAAEGLTALHLDNKLGALPWALVGEALERASQAHAALLEALAPHLAPLSPRRPRFTRRVQLAPSRVGRVIGRQGQNLKALCAELGVRVEVMEGGEAVVTGEEEAPVEAAAERLRAQGEPLRVGARYEARVDSLREYGAFVTFSSGGHSGLVHVSELRSPLPPLGADGEPAGEGEPGALAVGQVVVVELLGVDRQGRLRLSQRAEG
ncbi:MAG: polyribonucleotide nucleotidyltransferase [Deltaproteobacteria bacterium]|nr:polyribonucleotide nucleotidyltransferase [Deltaproteobacteria bacterium]